jgi:hypothetical protein
MNKQSFDPEPQPDHGSDWHLEMAESERNPGLFRRIFQRLANIHLPEETQEQAYKRAIKAQPVEGADWSTPIRPGETLNRHGVQLRDDDPRISGY